MEELLALLGGGQGTQGGGGLPGIASGLLGGIVGAFQRHSAKKWLKNHPQPIEGMPRELKENLGIANNMTNVGLPSEQYNNAMKNIQRQQMMALKSASDRRGALAILPGITDVTNNAISNLDASDAAARMNNQKFLTGVNSEVAGVKRDLFNKNIRQPYEQEKQYRMSELGAGDANLVGGLDKLLSSGIGLWGNRKGKSVGGGDDGSGIYTPSYQEYYGRGGYR